MRAVRLRGIPRPRRPPILNENGEPRRNPNLDQEDRSLRSSGGGSGRALATFSEALGLRLEQIEDIPQQKLRSYHLRVGDSHLELLFPTDPDSTVGRYLEKKGPGFHHWRWETDDILAERDRLVAAGFGGAEPGAVAGRGGEEGALFPSADHRRAVAGKSARQADPPELRRRLRAGGGAVKR